MTDQPDKDAASNADSQPEGAVDIAQDLDLDLPASEQEKPLEVQVATEDIGPARKKLVVTIPADQIAQRIESSFSEIKTDVQVPGFRKGRAPMRLIERRFGSAVRDDVRSHLVAEGYRQAVEQEKLEVIGEPEIKDFESIELPDEGDLSFEAEVEVTPHFDLPELTNLTVKKPAVSVDESTLEERLERFREREGQMAEVDEPVAEEDYVRCEVRILEGENAADDAAEIAHHPVTYTQAHGEKFEHKGHVVGILVPDMGKQLLGKTKDEVLRISMTGPSGHEEPRIKDQPITIVLKILAVERVQPASVEDLVARFGVEDEAALRNEIRSAMEEDNQRQARTKMHEQLCDQLLDAITMDLPEGLSSRQTARALSRRRMQLASEGTPEEEIEQRLAEMRAETQEDAHRQLKLFFILEKLAKELDVEVNEAEINGRIAAIARQYRRRPEKVRQEMHKAGHLEQLYLQIRDDKTLDSLLEKATIQEDAGDDSASGQAE